MSTVQQPNIYSLLRRRGRLITTIAKSAALFNLISAFYYLFMLLAMHGLLGEENQQWFSPANIIRLNDFTHMQETPQWLLHILEVLSGGSLGIALAFWTYRSYENAQYLAERSGRRFWEVMFPYFKSTYGPYFRNPLPNEATLEWSSQPWDPNYRLPLPFTKKAQEEYQNALKRSNVDIDDEGRVWLRPFWDYPIEAILSFCIPYLNLILPYFFLKRMLYGFHETATGYAHRRWLIYPLLCRVGISLLPSTSDALTKGHLPPNIDLALLCAIAYYLIDAVLSLCWIQFVRYTNESQEEFDKRELSVTTPVTQEQAL